MASNTEKLKMATDEVEEKENRIDSPSFKSPIIMEGFNKRDPFRGSDVVHYMRKDRLGNWTTVKGPIIQQRMKLPKHVTQQNQQARLFTKEAGSTEGLIQSIGFPRYSVTVPLHPLLHDYTVLHTRKDGWIVFFRETDLSIYLFNVIDPKPENLLSIPPITDIEDASIMSASLIGGASLGSVELFLIGAGVVEGHKQCGILLHLGRNESTWSVTRFPSTLPSKAAGPLLLDGGVLMAILDGKFLFTHNLHDLAVGISVLAGFRGMGNSILVKGRRGDVFAVQVPDLLYDAAPVVLEVGIGQAWLIPTITPVEEAVDRYYLSKDDVGFTLTGGTAYFANLMGDHHLCSFLNGAWEEGLDAHPSCTCSGGFLE